MDLLEAEKKYNGFDRPVAYFKINGNELSGKSLIYKDVRVTLTAGMEASDCTAEIVGAYSRFESGGLTMDAAMEDLVLGAKLEAFLGYGDAKDAESVFVGYISALETEIRGERISLLVTAMDCKMFMMSSYRSLRKKDIKKYSDAAADVLKNYSSLHDGVVTEASGEVKSPIEQHNQSDYEFVVSLAKKLNYLFYVSAGKVYFVSYKKFTDSVLTVAPGKNLRRLRREITLSHQVKSVTVRSHNPEDADNPFEAKAVQADTVGGGSKSAAASSKRISDTMAKVVVDNTVQSAAEAKVRAEALMNETAMEFLTGEIELPGLPPVIPGHMVTIKKINASFNRDYFITRVTHHMDTGGFETVIQFAGSKV